MIVQFLINGLITGMIYGLVALGFALVYNTTRIFHIAYAAIYMITPYFLLFFLKTAGIPIGFGLLLAIIITVFVGLSVELFVYSPLVKRNSSSNVILVSSIGVMIVLINLIALWFGNETKIINPGISKSVTFGSVLITYSQLIQFAVSSLLVLFFFVFLKYSQFG